MLEERLVFNAFQIQLGKLLQHKSGNPILMAVAVGDWPLMTVLMSFLHVKSIN